MIISQVVIKIVDEKQCVLIRPTNVERVKGEPYQYDVKEIFTGNKKKGWHYLDLFTANAMKTVLDALSPERKAMFDLLPLPKLIEFCWKCVN